MRAACIELALYTGLSGTRVLGDRGVIGAAAKALRRRFLSIDATEVSFAKRGFFSADESRREHLEAVGEHFLRGYHLALELRNQSLAASLSRIDAVYRGFAFEGAAMALGLLDTFSVSRRQRLADFLNDAGAPHRYVGHVGYGWVLARLPWSRRHPERFISQFDPLLRWLVIDGYGFHEGYFHFKRWIPPEGRQPKLSGYAARAFDQGLGRSLWFVAGADPVRAADLIRQFDTNRQADLWSGVGLACAYAGAPTADELACLCEAAGQHLLHLGQGAAFGAEARQLAGIPQPHTDLVCGIVCDMSAKEAAELTYTSRKSLPTDTADSPAYEAWRSSIRTQLQESIARCR